MRSDTLAALSRSFDVYYRDAARTRRMDRLNRRFVPAGGLAFDIGAHVGDRTASFRRLGATVVALEPQPSVIRALRLIHGRDSGVTLVPKAVADIAGDILFYVNSANPTVSTLSPDLIVAARHGPGWREEVWDNRMRVRATTLDRLITAHGLPDFVKIDVEGHEARVLQGLSVPLPALSFEFTMIQPDIVADCLSELARLGHYGFDFSVGENHSLQYGTWRSGAELLRDIGDLPKAANSGDIYAALDPR